MVGSEFHFKINGVPYRAAEDAEGEHYVLQTATLRAPNAQVVQGSDSNLVNMSPDHLVWSIDSWAGGEGQLKWTSENKDRSEIIEGLNFFGRPGNLLSGHLSTPAQDSGASAFSTEVGLVVAREQLYAVGIGAAADDFYAWATAPQFAAGVSIGSTDGARSPLAMAGDANYLFFVKHGTDEVWRWDGSSWANHNDQTGGNDATQLAVWGDYVYKLDQEGKVYELSKVTANTATPETPILDFSSDGDINSFAPRRIVAGDRRIYVLAAHNWTTTLYEIIPSSAAQAGYGREIKRWVGMRGESIWFHDGFVYWTGKDKEADGTVGARRVLYYLQPDASYGSLGEVRSFDLAQGIAGGTVMTGPTGLNTWGFAVASTFNGQTAVQAEMSLWEVDAISGGYGVTGIGDLDLGDQYVATSMAYHKGLTFITQKDRTAGTTHRIQYWSPKSFNNTVGFAISPAHDFGVAATKVLQSIELVTESLPTGTYVTLSYSLDGAAWVVGATFNTVSATGERVVISTDSAPKTFRSLRIKTALTSTSTKTPVVKAVNVRASVNETYKVWQLLVDCTDETSPRGFNGAKLIDNLLSLNNDTVIAFVDGYRDQAPNASTEYDVVVESVILPLSQAGQGYAQVVLREVV